MSIYHHNQPAAMARFRSNTDKQATMAGVTAPSFVCRSCGKRSKPAGRKQAVKGTSKFGYICAECAK